MITVDDSADLGSIPGRVNFLKFQISIPMPFFTCSGVYIDTFGLKISQPPWFGGSVVSQLSSLSRVRLLSPKSAGVEGTPRNPLVVG